jgi:hypothetical protein
LSGRELVALCGTVAGVFVPVAEEEALVVLYVEHLFHADAAPLGFLLQAFLLLPEALLGQLLPLTFVDVGIELSEVLRKMRLVDAVFAHVRVAFYRSVYLLPVLFLCTSRGAVYSCVHKTEHTEED